MALEFLPPISQEGTTSLVDIMPVVASGKVETVTLAATIKSGSTDAYGSVYLSGPTSGYVRCQEPVKYRVAGGSPDLLIQFQVPAGCKLQVQASANSVVQFTLYNCTRDDA